MSNLKRTRDNFPKMKVRGARRKWEMKLESIARIRQMRFDLAMRKLTEAFGQVGMAVTVTADALEKFAEANRIESDV